MIETIRDLKNAIEDFDNDLPVRFVCRELHYRPGGIRSTPEPCDVVRIARQVSIEDNTPPPGIVSHVEISLRRR